MHFFYGLNLVWVGLDASVRYQKTQEFALCDSEDALVGVEHDVDLAEIQVGFLKVIYERALFAILTMMLST